jgi:hypothetical protein
MVGHGLDVLGGEGVARALWGDARGEERFIGVDVADTREDGLVEQRSLDRSVGGDKGVVQGCWRDGERVGPEGAPAVGAQVFEGWVGPHASEAARISEQEMGFVRGFLYGFALSVRCQCPANVDVIGLRRACITWQYEQLARHAQVQAEGGAARFCHESELLAKPANIRDLMARQEQIGRGLCSLEVVLRVLA